MKEIQNTRINYILIPLFLLCGLSVALLCIHFMNLRQYQIVSLLAGTAAEIHEDFAEELILSLKEPNPGAAAAGQRLLDLYGYAPEDFWRQNSVVLGVFCLLLFAALGLALLLLRRREWQRRLTRIQDLTGYLALVNRGTEGVLPRREDELSFLEDELFKTVTELKEAREKALAERRSLADNLADISHQLKTPITSMSLMTQLLAENCAENRQRSPFSDPASINENINYVNKISRQLSRLEELVSSLLTLSRLDAGTLVLERTELDAPALLTLAAESLESIFSERKQTFTIFPTADTRFIGDRSWTLEALLNILKNCSEHTPEGGGIRARCDGNPLYAQILIEDDGAGFDPEDIPRLFQRFYRGKNAARDSIGIGLALSRSIIERQNGTIKAENRSEGGARFAIRFYR